MNYFKSTGFSEYQEAMRICTMHCNTVQPHPCTCKSEQWEQKTLHGNYTKENFHVPTTLFELQTFSKWETQNLGTWIQKSFSES